MSDLLFQNLMPVQDGTQPLPPTIPSAATIAPTHMFTFVTGTVQVGNITPPTTGACLLWLCFTNGAPGLLLTTGNIQFAYQPITNRPFAILYDPSSAKWWCQAVV
jgi:hypothetical protein